MTRRAVETKSARMCGHQAQSGGETQKGQTKKMGYEVAHRLEQPCFFLVLGEGRFCPTISTQSNNTEKPEAANVVIDLSIIYSFILNSTLSLSEAFRPGKGILMWNSGYKNMTVRCFFPVLNESHTGQRNARV